MPVNGVSLLWVERSWVRRHPESGRPRQGDRGLDCLEMVFECGFTWCPDAKLPGTWVLCDQRDTGEFEERKFPPEESFLPVWSDFDQQKRMPRFSADIPVGRPDARSPVTGPAHTRSPRSRQQLAFSSLP